MRWAAAEAESTYWRVAVPGFVAVDMTRWCFTWDCSRWCFGRTSVPPVLQTELFPLVLRTELAPAGAPDGTCPRWCFRRSCRRCCNNGTMAYCILLSKFHTLERASVNVLLGSANNVTTDLSFLRCYLYFCTCNPFLCPR